MWRQTLLGNLAHAILLAPLLFSLCAAHAGAAISATPKIEPSKEAARRNAFRIFNSVSSAMRQWGSSLQHNGLSYFLATVPQDSLFYHGSNSSERPSGLEWLAFEIEHAQVFAQPRGPRGKPPGSRPPPGGGPGDGLQHPMGRHGGGSPFAGDHRSPPPPPGSDDQSTDARGYLHTYRATRPLKLLYIDGMAAGKADFGTMDAQDLVLLGWELGKEPGGGGRGPMGGERERSKGLCQLAEEWGWDVGGARVDGFVRMEAGFEIIYCNFREGGGLELVSADASPLRNETGFVGDEIRQFEWLRACSLRYHGFPAGRIDVDWSSMVSAFFYDVNLTNPDERRSELPRVLNTTAEERGAIRSRVGEVVTRRHVGTQASVNWQGVVDMIIARYADRFELMVSDTLTKSQVKDEVNLLLSPYVDYDGNGKPSLERCQARYLESALAAREKQGTTWRWTTEDEMIYTALYTVTGRICGALIEARELASRAEEENSHGGAKSALDVVKTLADELSWPIWRDCGRCNSRQEICFVAMFPAGSTEDHYAPRCKDAAALADWRGAGESYWHMGRPPT